MDTTTASGRPAQAAAAPSRADLMVARLERVPLSPRHFGVASILGAATFFDAYDALAIGSALTVIFTTLHIGFARSGLLLGTAYLGQFVGAIVAGALSERYGRKRVFIVALVVLCGFAVVSAVSWDFTSLLTARILQGLGLGAEIPIAAALLNELVPARSRGWFSITYQNLFTWGFLLTPLIAVGLIQLAGEQAGWRLILLFGAAPLLLIPVAGRWLPESVRWLINHGQTERAEVVVETFERSARESGRALPEPEVRAPAETAPTRLGELLSPAYRRRTALIWIMFPCSFFVSWAYSTWLPTLFVSIGHLPVKQSLLLAVVSGVVGVVAGYLAASVVDWIGRRLTFVLGFSVMMLGALVGAVGVALGHTGWPLLLAATLIIRFGNTPTNVGLFMYSAELFPTRMRAWATGTGSGLQRLASAVGPSVVGFLLAGSVVRGVGIMFLLFALMPLIALVAVLTLGVETRRRAFEEISR